MGSRPVRWRARWALAQITGVIFSSAVWIVLAASARELAIIGLIVGTGFVAARGTRLMLWLAVGAWPARVADRDVVLRAIVPVASLRGRNQPRVFVSRGRRAGGWDVRVLGRRTLVVSESLMVRIRSGEIPDLEVSALVAHELGRERALGSRAVAVVDVWCLPWALVEFAAAAVVPRLSRIPLMSLSWRMRPVVFGLGLFDAVQHARWEAAVPLLVLVVLTYTTGPFRRSWQRTLAELGDRRVAKEGLAGAADLQPGRSSAPLRIQQVEILR